MRKPDGAGGVNSLVATGRFLVVAASLAILMPAYVGALTLLSGDSLPGDYYFIGVVITFVSACFFGLIIGVPTWLFAKSRNWQQSLPNMLGLGAVAGAFSVAIIPVLVDPATLSLDAIPIVGVPAGMLAAALWFVLQTRNRRKTRDE